MTILGNITEHPKIAINKDEYDRIQRTWNTNKVSGTQLYRTKPSW